MIRRAAMILFVVMLGLGLRPASHSMAQSTESTVLVVVFTCPAADADPFTECEQVSGVSVQVTQDGVDVAGSPAVTAFDTLYTSAMFTVADDRNATYTLTGGIPEGYEAADGNSITARTAELELIGMGGESTGPWVPFMLVPAAAEPEPTPTENEPVTELPSTGAGIDNDDSMSGMLLIIASLVTAAGGAVALRWRAA